MCVKGSIIFNKNGREIITVFVFFGKNLWYQRLFFNQRGSF